MFNGDLGIITVIDQEESVLTVNFEGRDVEYGFGELDELVLAYATTIHKAMPINKRVTYRSDIQGNGTLNGAAANRSFPGVALAV